MIDSLLARKQATRHHQRKLHVKCAETEIDKGDRLFVGADCLSSQQVAAYFSRLAATKRKHGSLATTVVSLEEVEEFLNEEQMEEHEDDISRKKKAVSSNLQLKHPITYKSYNLCNLAADGKLATKFNIAELKNMQLS